MKGLNSAALEKELMESFPGCPKGRDLTTVFVSQPVMARVRPEMGSDQVLTFLGVPVYSDHNLSEGEISFAFAPKKEQPFTPGAVEYRPVPLTLCPECCRAVPASRFVDHFHDHAVLKEKK